MLDSLHVCVGRSGKMVDDRYLPRQGRVTVGSGAKSSVALVGSKLPKEIVLWTFDASRPTLHVPEGLTGEVALDGTHRQSLAELAARGRQTPTGTEVELPDASRGWLALGDATIFFHFAPKPPLPPKRTLPATAKPRLFAGLEKTFTAAFAGVMLFEAGGVVAIGRRPDIGVDLPPPEPPPRQFRVPLPRAMPLPRPHVPKIHDVADRNRPPPAKPGEAARHEREVQKAIDKAGIIFALTNGKGQGPLKDIFDKKAFGNEVDGALQKIDGKKIADAMMPGASRTATGPKTEDIHGLSDFGGPGHQTVLEERRVVRPQIRIAQDDIEVASPSFDRASLATFIRERKDAIEYCYDQQLKLNPKLAGKLLVSFTITPTGQVRDVSIDENTLNDDVAACVRRLVAGWYIPHAPKEDTPVSFPFVFAPAG